MAVLFQDVEEGEILVDSTKPKQHQRFVVQKKNPTRMILHLEGNSRHRSYLSPPNFNARKFKRLEE